MDVLRTVLFSLCAFSVHCSDIRLGIILPEDGSHEFSLKRVLPAIDYAIESVNKSNILPGYDLVPLVKNSECSDTMGPLAAVDFHIYDKVHAFFGPVCDYAVAPVARFASFWNTPVLTAGAIAVAFGNKSEYNQLTRVHGAYSNRADLFLTIAKTYNWTNIGLMLHDNIVTKGAGRSSCFFRLEAVFDLLNRVNGKKTSFQIFDERFPASFDYENLLRLTSKHTRSK